MCGIIALVAKHQAGFYMPDTTLFSQMLVADSLRGADSTGVFGVKRNGSVDFVKVGAHPYALLNSKQYSKWAQSMIQDFTIVVGHNRKATSGDVNNENAHPFVHEHIILVHNGTLFNHKSLADTEVDSHAIAHLLAKKPPEEAIKEINGAFALIWFNVKDNKLYAVRNNDRPLFYCETNDHIVIASEDTMLTWIAERNAKKWATITALKAGSLLCIDQASKALTFETVPLHTWKNSTYYQGMGDCGWEGGCGYEEWTVPDTALAETELQEAKRLAAQVVDDAAGMSVDDKVIIDFVEKYKDGQEITFVPESITAWSNSTANLKGFHLLGKVREAPDIYVKATFTEIDDKLEDRLKTLLKNASLSGKVEAVMYYPHNHQKLLSVNNIIARGTFRAFNGTVITAKEWVEITQNCKCTGCAKKLKTKDLKVTSLKKIQSGWRVFCPRCVAGHFDKLKPEVQENIIKINGVNPVDYISGIEETSLKGSSHGS